MLPGNIAASFGIIKHLLRNAGCIEIKEPDSIGLLGNDCKGAMYLLMNPGSRESRGLRVSYKYLCELTFTKESSPLGGNSS